MPKTLRILYAAGPGNIIGTYNYWVEGRDDPSQVALTYSSQFYEMCCALDAQAYVISRCEERKFLHDGQFTLEHRPICFYKKSGILFNLGKFLYGVGLIASAICFRANFAVVADGTTHWFLLSLLVWLRIQVIPSLHCVLWPSDATQTRIKRLILELDRSLFTSGCAASLTVSDNISKQVAQITNGQHRLVVEFLPIYRRTEFEEVGVPDENRSPFRVFFASRLERDKGVFDLLEIAKRFMALGRQDIIFDVCGDGSELESLRLSSQLAGVDSLFSCHGYCNKLQMREMFSKSHVVIVPTRTDFVEGFNKVVAESVLAGRPVITSAVCPALSYVRDAAVEVPSNDTQAYGDALLRLCDDREFYEEKRRGCLALQEQFYDLSRSWGAALKNIIVTNWENKA